MATVSKYDTTYEKIMAQYGSVTNMAGAIASALDIAGNGSRIWQVEVPGDQNRPSYFKLLGPGGLEVGGHIDYWGARIVYSGIYPTGEHGTSYRPSTTVTVGVALGRPAKAHAAEIARRLLPGYSADLALARARKERDDWDDFAAGLTLAHFGRLLGDKPFGQGRDAGTVRWHEQAFDKGYGDVTVMTGGSMRIDLRSLPPATAERVVALLAKIGAPHDDKRGRRVRPEETP